MEDIRLKHDRGSFSADSNWIVIIRWVEQQAKADIWNLREYVLKGFDEKMSDGANSRWLRGDGGVIED